jgi:hypothetical protein
MQTQQIDAELLDLDEQNPRLPEELRGANQEDLLGYLLRTAVLDELARSMVDNGYFPHEPLIVVPKDDGRFRVVEGNRRTAALMLLLELGPAAHGEPTLALDPAPSRPALEALQAVPCVVVESRAAVDRFIGFRHIGGIKTWPAEAKARWILQSVEDLHSQHGEDEHVFKVLARRVGSNAQGIRNPYLAMKILVHARQEFGVDTSELQQERFGVWNRCMNSPELREYIGFGDGAVGGYSDVAGRLDGLVEANLREVISDLTRKPGAPRALLRDSRQVTAYASILMNDEAHRVLREHEDLELAEQIIERATLGARIERVATEVQILLRQVERDGPSAESVEPAQLLARLSRSLLVLLQTDD